MSELMIVKVQAPLFTTGREIPASARFLIYDEKRLYPREQTVPESVVKAMGGEAKVYFEAIWNGRQWEIGAKVKPQSW